MAAEARIVISGIRAFAYHGCTPEERERGQEFRIDVELEYDASAAVGGDDLEKAVDYDRVASQVHEMAREKKYRLIETLAERIGRHLAGSTAASLVRVRVHKPQAPMHCEVSDVMVEMTFEDRGR